MRKVQLNDICELIVDCPHSTAVDEGDGYPLVRTPNIGKGRLIYQGMHRVSEAVYLQRNKRATPQEDDLIFAREATAGNVALIQRDEKVCLGQRTVLIRPNKSIVNPAFLTYYLLAPMQQYNLLSTANGSTVAHVNLPTIRNLKLELPELYIQRRIASILSAYDNLIENNTRRIRLLEQMAENIYKEWFVRFRFPGHENAEFENGLPKGWKEYSIKELCDINNQTLSSKDKSKVIDYLDTSSITCNQISGTECFTVDAAPSRARRIVKDNSIVFSTVRPNLKHYGILKGIPDNMIVSTGFAVFDAKYDIANIIFLFLSTQDVVDYCQSIAEGAVATYPSIKAEEIGRLRIALPEKTIAEKWNKKFEAIYIEMLNLQRQSNLLARQRDLLLPRLMSGKIEINVEPN